MKFFMLVTRNTFSLALSMQRLIFLMSQQDFLLRGTVSAREKAWASPLASLVPAAAIVSTTDGDPCRETCQATAILSS
jgi:hypothetical protein